MCVLMDMQKQARGQCLVSSATASLLSFLRQVIHWSWSSAIWLDWNPPVSLSSTLAPRVPMCTAVAGFFSECWGPEHRSSCTCSKSFIDGAASPVLSLCSQDCSNYIIVSHHHAHRLKVGEQQARVIYILRFQKANYHSGRWLLLSLWAWNHGIS